MKHCDCPDGVLDPSDPRLCEDCRSAVTTMVPVLPLYLTDPRAFAICQVFGHVGEGRIAGRFLVGRCNRCGVGLLTDGSC